MVLVNEIKPIDQNYAELVNKAKEAIDILKVENLRAVRLHTSNIWEMDEKNSDTWPCILEFYLKPMHEAILIPIEVRIYGLTSGSDKASTTALFEILKYAGFSMAHNARYELFSHQTIKVGPR